MRILYCGPRNGNSMSRYEAIQSLGHTSYLFDPKDLMYSLPRIWRGIEWRLRNGPIIYLMNKSLERCLKEVRPDVLWIEKGMIIYTDILKIAAAMQNCFIVGSHSDDFLSDAGNGVSRHFNSGIPIYDLIFTPRDVNFEELYARGAKHVDKFWKGYDQERIKPLVTLDGKTTKFAYDVMFIGHHEPERYQYLKCLNEKGISLKIGGGDSWPGISTTALFGRVDGIEFAKAYSESKIGINFFSEWNRDSQNSRLFEIPATKTFLLSQRTKDAMQCFDEGTEAEYFSSKYEFYEKIKYYLENDTEREAIAERGYKRCLTSGYSNYHRTKIMIENINGYRDDYLRSVEGDII